MLALVASLIASVTLCAVDGGTVNGYSTQPYSVEWFECDAYP